MSSFDFNDEGEMDRLDYLADIHQDFFEWLHILWAVPDDIPDWEFFVTPPSDEELEQMNRLADDLLGDLHG